jgi:serine protease AprX
MRKVTSPKLTVIFSLLLILQLSIPAFAGISFIPGQGVVLTGADGVVLTGADGVVLTGADGLVLTGADGLVLTGADGVVLTGADAFTYTGLDGVVLTGADASGIHSIDPELAILLNNLPDTSAINVFLVFHQMPTQSDFDALRAVFILGGTRFRNLPIVQVNATKRQIVAISRLATIRSIYSNKTCEFFTHDTRVITGQSSVITDRSLTMRNDGVPLSGQGVTVAVLDTGIDATHPDLRYGSQVIQNVRVGDLQSIPLTFTYPITLEGLPNSDFVMGHGTLVASVIAGTGAASGGYYGGMAPGARLLGISGGDASLFFVLSGIDYILSHRLDQNIKVVNCSFGISGLFDEHDPVNIATKIMHDNGITVVFSAGNRGDQPNSLNPYSVAPWVISVGSGTKGGSLSSFSSRGAAEYGPFYPSLIAPGEKVIGARAIGINVVGTSGLSAGLVSQDNDLQTIPVAYLSHYTSCSGTSFAAPHVAATAALMLQANPALSPDQIKNILQSSATPMLGYSRHEVGAGYLNTYAAVRKAAYGNPFGQFRIELNNSAITLSRVAAVAFNGEVAPGETYSRIIDLPFDTAFATAQIGWIRTNGAVNNLNVTLMGRNQTVTAKPAVQLIGTAFKKSGVTISDPTPGRWMLTVTNTSDSIRGTSQLFAGAIEITRANYSVSGLDQLSQSKQLAAKRALLTGLMVARSNAFDSDVAATRLEVARAVMLGAGAHVPQYLPYSPSFTDVPSDSNAIFVESVTHSPNGDLMRTSGAQFNPQASADRLTTAIAIVKALGLDSDAQAADSSNPGIADWDAIPATARGYVKVATTRGLMSTNLSSYFRPFDSITRGELAAAAVALQQAAR